MKKTKWSGGKCPYCKEEHLAVSPFCAKYPIKKKRRLNENKQDKR